MSENNPTVTKLFGTTNNEVPTALSDVDTNGRPTIDMRNKDQRDLVLDFAFQENGGPGYTTALSGALKGIRILGPGNEMLQLPDNVIGLNFVSRPLLNLSDSNIRLHENLVNLESPRNHSIQGYVKGMLDKRSGQLMSNDLFDNKYAWIPLLTNLCKVSTGFPDVSLNFSKSSPGFRNQVYQRVDGILTFNMDLNIRQTYSAMKPNILPMLFESWVQYIEGVTLGDEGMSPYPEALIQNYVDYDCRIYHLIMNKNMRSLEGIYCTGGSAPNMLPVGAQSTIDRTSDSNRGQGQDEYEMNFEGVGFRFNSVIACDMFNRCSYYFNPELEPQVRNNYYRKLEVAEYFSAQYGNQRIYPLINIKTMELEYWGPK